MARAESHVTEQTPDTAYGSYRNWRVERDADLIIWVYADKANTSTNVLSKDVLEEFDDILRNVEADAPRALVVMSAKPNGFIAGADVKEFTQLADEAEARELVRRGQSVLSRLEALSCPTVAVIHGFCLGGGLELALACRYRVADMDSAKLGLPEVQLGIHPGFGGTVRLPPLIGAPAAMDMMLSGRSVSARSAAKMGLVDHAVPSRQLQQAARQVALHPPRPKRATGWKGWTNHDFVRPLLAPMLRKQVAKRARPDHYPAPYALIDLWMKHGNDRDAMMREEAASVARLVRGDTARNLVRVFFLQERMKSLGKKDLISPRHVHVIGGGVMGGDIAAWCALSGMTVTVQDRKEATLARVLKRAHGLYSKKLKHPRLVQNVMDRLVPDVHGRGLARADVVIEAIFEDAEAKQNLFREIQKVIRPDAILATNTSSIPLEVLCQALDDPGRLVGLHFFNPVAKMMLVEIVRGENTDPQVVERAAAFTRHIDRLPLPVTSSPGFLVNRVLMPYLLEAVLLESEGVPGPVIDKAAVTFGMPMGPILLADTVGLDICLSVAEILGRHFDLGVPDRLRQLVSAGYLGKKSGRGFYVYKGDKPELPKADPGYAAPADLTDRLVLRMLNECVSCLREGVVEDSDLLDGGVIFGTGFAPFRGGPLQYVKEHGVGSMQARLRELGARHGKRFEEDPGWSEL